MSRFRLIVLWGCVFFASCAQDDWSEHSPVPESDGAVFGLNYGVYDGAETRTSLVRAADYDRVEFRVIDESGAAVGNLKGLYDASSSEFRIEGLRTGSYRLLILGIRGDERQDGAVIHPISRIDEEWISFPADLGRPLSAEYFYSQSPFTVTVRTTPDGISQSEITGTETLQQRIVGRADFTFTFGNPYVRTAVESKRLVLSGARFRTGMNGFGEFVGESDAADIALDLDETASYLFLPTLEDLPLEGEVEIVTRTYRGGKVRRLFGFELDAVAANRIGTVHTRVVHPDDGSGTMFVTPQAYEESAPGLILQDGEPKSVYTDASQRRFNTAAPLQLSVTDDGRFHARFYSPRPLTGVLVRARIPGVDSEFLDLAWFDTIPAFADFYGMLPLTQGPTRCLSETGRWVSVPQLRPEELAGIEFRIESEDPYWQKLQGILHGWNIAFSLYGGDPDLPNGGPVGNWMGIRPVHCREVVAFFLNFTYMIDMPEHEEILHANADRLYGNGGVEDKVSVETVLRQMRQTRSLNVGLVYAGNGVVGLGGGSSFGAYQQAWIQHYFNTYSCEIMFHELGHVMGYSHSSSFTYGPWAQELMNNFYVKNLWQMPIDSPSYLNSRENPTLYP